ncbi:unnamed protein product [Somion occarium]|uniref:F-box domain-containing protein n=1 Tax=Somion occarium TaxID=3059160 RepID=A0ABP1DT50_9APHY
MACSISRIPEELVERILSYALAPSPSSYSALAPIRSSSKPDTSLSLFRPSTPSVASFRLSPLLVCKLWLRIGTPLYYRSIHLTSQHQTRLLASLLESQPSLGACIREVRVEGVFSGLVDVVRHLGRCVPAPLGFNASGSLLGDGQSPGHNCKKLEKLDCRLDGSTSIEDVQAFCAAVDALGDVKHLVVRKNANAYLTQPGAISVMKSLSDGVRRWIGIVSIQFSSSTLCISILLFLLPIPVEIYNADASFLVSQESVELAFRFSPIISNSHTTVFHIGANSISPNAHIQSVHSTASLNTSDDTFSQLHPTAQLTSALTHAPNLKVFKTELPAVWNTALLEISSNTSLRRIHICNPPLSLQHQPQHRSQSHVMCPYPSPSHVQFSTLPSFSSLYMREARKHPRLMELIRAGMEVAGIGADAGTHAMGGGARHRAWTLATGDSPPPSPPAPSSFKTASVNPTGPSVQVAWPVCDRAGGFEDQEGGGEGRLLGVQAPQTRKGKERRLSAA